MASIATINDWRGLECTVRWVDGEIEALGELLGSDTVLIEESGSAGIFTATLGFGSSRPLVEHDYAYDATTGSLIRTITQASFVFVAVIQLYSGRPSLVWSIRYRTAGPIPDSTGVWGGEA